MKPSDNADPGFRAGAAGLGVLGGLVLGLAMAGVLSLIFRQEPSFPVFIFGGSAAGGVLGLVWPESAFTVAEAAVQFVFGSAFGLQGVEPEQQAPTGLKVLFWLGAAASVLAYVFTRR